MGSNYLSGSVLFRGEQDAAGDAATTPLIRLTSAELKGWKQGESKGGGE